MVVETKFYDILEVPPNADEEQIKKGYRNKARLLHPDKAKSEDEKPEQERKFKELGHAYAVLSNAEKRRVYDQYGEEGLEGGGGANGMSADDLFTNFFSGGGGPFGGLFGGGGGGRPSGPMKAKTIVHVHKVSLEDIYRGKVSKLALQKSVICSKCSGLGGKEGAVKKCAGCDGRGVKTMLRQMGPMIQRFQTVCPDCGGEGEIIRDRDRCKQCNGKKTVVERKILHVHVDRGVKSGAKIEFRGEGDQIPGVEAGDVVFEIEEKPHPRFQRKDDDLFYHAEIDLLTAIAGGALHIEHLDDRWITIDIVPGEVISSNMVKVVRGQGMPSYRHHDFGNLYIQFEVKFPDRLGGPEGTLRPEDIAALERILPPRIEPPAIPADAMTEDFVLEDVDPSRDNARSHNITDEDDDEMHAGAERVQCATQ